jgi:hypothetical protein
MRVSINMVTNIYNIPLYVPPKISNNATNYETKIKIDNAKTSRSKTVTRKQCCQIMLP